MPEIARRIHQTSVEMVAPDPIDNGSPGQGIAGIGDPLGQGLAPASLVIRVRQTELMRRRPDGRESAGPGDFAGALDVAAVQDMDLPGTVTDDTVNQLR